MITRSPPPFSRSVAAIAATLLLLVAPFTASQNAAAPTFPPAPPDPTMAPGNAPPPPSATPGDSPTACVDPVNGFELVTIGQPTTICLVLANDEDWSTQMKYMRLNFSPIADTYSRFHVPQSFDQLIQSPTSALATTFPNNISVHTESQSALSFQKLYYNGIDRVFPFLTAIISVNEGVVTGITWDNACVFCSPDECIDNTYGYDGVLATSEEAQQKVGACSVPIEQCRLSESAECDLMLYVVWTGTDSNGKDFMSSASRFSAFPKQSWGDMISLGLPGWMSNPFGDDESDAN